MPVYQISSKELTYENIQHLMEEGWQIALSDEAIHKVEHCRDYLDNKLDMHAGPVYGINTGFGSLCEIEISKEQLKDLQRNLVMSHACGTGDEVSEQIVKLMLLLKIQNLSYGHSGVQLDTVKLLVEFFNKGIYPVVYEQGSLGASGDLAPLAHLSLPLLGLGEVTYKGEKMPASKALFEAGLSPVDLKSKEGLALLNGTQFMGAYGVYCLLRSFRLSTLADLIGALSLDAFDGRIEPFYLPLHEIRNHKGQISTAKGIANLLESSELMNKPKNHVQDPYSFRCIPQVHGASKDAIEYVAKVFSCEMNAVTDNPTIFPYEDLIISGGNFHGQPLALALDFLAIALSELGNISERRTYQLISGKRNLPHFLVVNPGLHSGFMIPQYTAASIVNQNKQLCTPSSVDSIESSQGQEDHVSMGANAATKALKVVNNLQRILAIELFNAAQALEFRRPAKSSPLIENFVHKYRQYVPFIQYDEVMHPHIENSIRFLSEVKLPISDLFIPNL